MKLEQLGRLRAMADLSVLDSPDLNHWDLNREDKHAIAAAIEKLPNPRLVAALEAVLLFYHVGPWTSEETLRWHNLTGLRPLTLKPYDVTTKGLCDFIRDTLGVTT